MMVHRRILKKRKVVYLLTAASAVKYRGGRSRVVYIGTTKKGVGRIAGSAAWRAEDIMSRRGLKELHVFVVSCSSRPGVPTWEWLEDALLAAFRAEYEQLPICNSQGKKKKWNDELDRMFKRRAIEKVLKEFDASKN
jgi:hypothetical protein